MAPLPTLELAVDIVRAFLNDDFLLVIVYGTQRIGKSCYVSKCIAQALDFLFGVDFWNEKTARKYMGWHPEEVSDYLLTLDDKLPAFHWDDAGMWLFSLKWNDPVLIAFQQYMSVIGTDFSCLILSTPDPRWILSKIANSPGLYRVRIIKRSGTRRIDAPKSVKYSRRAIGYKPYMLPDLKKTGVRKPFMDDFTCLYPDDFYKWYKPTRERYAMLAKQAIRKALREKLEKKKRGRPKKEARSIKNLKR